jgi:NitT/TauT family transport system permease protein
MTRFQQSLAIFAGGVSLLGLVLAVASGGAVAALLVYLALAALTLSRFAMPLPTLVDGAIALAGALVLIWVVESMEGVPLYFWLALVAAWAFAWLFVERLSLAIKEGRLPPRGYALIIPVVFGASLLVIWEVVTVGANVPQVLLPPPSQIWSRLLASLPILWADFQQTFLKAVLAGYVIGCGAGFIVAILVDRSPFLKQGLLPIGNFVSALPIIGIAPILVMWFGFDWPSKAAVVVVMVFFPMLVNTVAGLNATGAMERDLMRTYAAPYWQTLFKLRLPAAAPFIFNALKINSTLALIGAIVAEFFGTPIVGMGFRISTEVGKLNIDLVWAEIAMAAVAGSAFYGVIALIERAVTFWHPSVRGGRA